jgi:hypothetical protein
MFFKVTEEDGLWKKIRNHVGTTVKHPVSPATRDIHSRISDEGVQKTVSVCPYCASHKCRHPLSEGVCHLRYARLAAPQDKGHVPQTLLR